MPNSTIGVLLDNGNFILTSKLHNNIVLWQSFDDPTNTWLPGAKIGYNRLTNESKTLKSWKNSENPENGRFSTELEVEKNGTSHLVLYYWSTTLIGISMAGKCLRKRCPALPAASSPRSDPPAPRPPISFLDAWTRSGEARLVFRFFFFFFFF
jgi:hypothetical protein